jgi:hypothetical protein
MMQGKGMSKEIKAKRAEQVEELTADVEDIPDGVNVRGGRMRPRNGKGGRGGEINIKDDSSADTMFKYGSSYYQVRRKSTKLESISNGRLHG